MNDENLVTSGATPMTATEILARFARAPAPRLDWLDWPSLAQIAKAFMNTNGLDSLAGETVTVFSDSDIAVAVETMLPGAKVRLRYVHRNDDATALFVDVVSPDGEARQYQRQPWPASEHTFPRDRYELVAEIKREIAAG